MLLAMLRLVLPAQLLAQLVVPPVPSPVPFQEHWTPLATQHRVQLVLSLGQPAARLVLPPVPFQVH